MPIFEFMIIIHLLLLYMGKTKTEPRKSHGSTAVSRRTVSLIYASFEEDPVIKDMKYHLRKILMHASDLILHEGN